MSVNLKNQVHQLFEDKTDNSHNESHPSNTNSEDENENRQLMIAEDDEEVKHDCQPINTKGHRKSANEMTSTAGKVTNIPTVDKYKMTKNSVENNIFVSQKNEDLEVKEKKYKTNPNQRYANKSTQQSLANEVLEHQSKRKRGRPEKLLKVNKEFDDEPVAKKPRGRPKKSLEKIELKEKKPVGRPRIYFNTEPKEKKPIGRPKKYFHLKINKEPRPPGRPRTNFRFKVIKEKRSRGRPRANLRLQVIKEKRSRGRPRRNFDIVKENRPRGRPKSNFKLVPFSRQVKENTTLIRKRGRPKKLIPSECRKSLRTINKTTKDVSFGGDVCNNANIRTKLVSHGNIDKPKRKRGRPKKLKVKEFIRHSRFGGSSSNNEESSHNSSDYSDSVNIDGIKLEKI